MAGSAAEQRKYLKDKLDSISRSKNIFWGGDDVELPKSAEVVEAEKALKRAEKIINRYHGRCKSATKRQHDTRKVEFEACRREALFGDTRKALKMLEAFEKKW